MNRAILKHSSMMNDQEYHESESDESSENENSII